MELQSQPHVGCHGSADGSVGHSALHIEMMPPERGAKLPLITEPPPVAEISYRRSLIYVSRNRCAEQFMGEKRIDTDTDSLIKPTVQHSLPCVGAETEICPECSGDTARYPFVARIETFEKAIGLRHPSRRHLRPYPPFRRHGET